MRWAVGAALVAIAVYANTLAHDFTYDDRTVVVQNEAARDPAALKRIFLASSWSSNAEQTIAFRPLTTWTFALNHAIDAGPLGYHVLNVLAHAAVSALVVVLAMGAGLPAATAGLAGILFAVHPIHTEAVANTVGRAEILAAGLALLALILRRFPFAAVVAYALALLAKEHAIALLVLLPLAELLVDHRRPRAQFYAALLAVTVAYVLLRATAIGRIGVDAARIPLWQNVAAHAGPVERLFTALYVAARAGWLLVVPVNLSADYSFAEIPLVASLHDPRAWIGIAFAGGLVALAVLLRRSSRALFWLGVGVVPYVVVSNLLVPSGTIFGERLLYLPSVALCVGEAVVLVNRRALAALLLAAFALRTVTRNPIWHDNLTLAEATVKTAPRSAQAHHLLATTLFERGRYDDALREFRTTLDIYPDDVDALFNAGAASMLLQRNDEALGFLDRVTAREPNHFAAWIDEAAIHNARAEFDAGLRAAERATAIRPDAPNGYVMRGFALRGLGRLADAQAAFQTALQRQGVGMDALYGLGATALDLGDATTAVRAFEQLVRVAPSAGAYRGLVIGYRQTGRDADANRVAEEARRRFPSDPFFAR